MQDQALSDIRVIEYGNCISAPYCGKLLADLGAEVIKVEKPKKGDESRHHGPFPGDAPHIERSGLFLYINTHCCPVNQLMISACYSQKNVKSVNSAKVLCTIISLYRKRVNRTRCL